MAKLIKYKFLSSEINLETITEPVETLLQDVVIYCNSSNLETNEQIAKMEAYLGEYTIEDDGQPEPDMSTADDILNALLGVTE